MKIQFKKILFVLFFLVVSGTTEALINQGGYGGFNFSCDVNTGRCKCDGVWEGADCQAMKKNCKNGEKSACHDEPGDPKWCICDMYKTDTKKPKIKRVIIEPVLK